jgi:RNase H-like domain found in reverse transcriptase
LEINLDKCILGNKEVSYLGFTLTPEGIKPRKNKIKAIQTAKPPNDVKTLRSFVGLCNFFRTHIKDFAVITCPLFKLTRKDSGYKGPLPPASMDAFINLRKQLILEPVMAFPRTNQQYALITDAVTGTADTPGGLGAILTQVDQDGKFYTFLLASLQLKDHEKKLFSLSTQSCGRSMGDGSFQQVPQRQEVHPVHGPQAVGDAGPPAQQDYESIPNSTSRTRLHYSIQKGVRHAG